MTESQYDDYYNNFSSSSIGYTRYLGGIINIRKNEYSFSFNIDTPDLKAITLAT